MIDMNKQYRYRTGGDARILCVDGPDSKYPVVSMDHAGDLRTHTADGNINEQTLPRHYDLIEVIPLWRGKVWVRDRDGVCLGYPTGDQSFRPITAVEERSES